MINNSAPTTIEPQTSVERHTPRSSRITKRFVSWLLALLLIAGLAYWQIGRSQAKNSTGAARHAGQTPPVPVLVAAARNGDISVYLNGLGTVTAFNTVTVKSRVDGQLVRVAFREGQSVQAGDL